MVEPPLRGRTPTLVMARSLIYAGVFYVVTALFLLLGSWLLIAPRRWAMKGLEIHGQTCVALLRLICGTRLEVRGRENLPKGGCLVVAKHQSAWDTFALIPLFRDPAVVLKDELKWIPFYGWFCVKFAHILVKREKASAALKSLIADAKARLAEGREIVIFPEGTRTIPGAEPAYKPGYVALYEALGAPAVPLALNSGLYWPRRSIWRYPGVIVVEILAPIPPGLPRAEFRSRMEAAIENASRALIVEAAASENPPPMPPEAEKVLDT
ncbi:MAG: lysophospholipid acyltransferase family protein [Hyphomicrobium sp.]